MQNQSTERDVLFQKLGETWYAFTQVGEDFVYSALPEGINPKDTKIELFEVIEEHMDKVAKSYKNNDVAA